MNTFNEPRYKRPLTGELTFDNLLNGLARVGNKANEAFTSTLYGGSPTTAPQTAPTGQQPRLLSDVLSSAGQPPLQPVPTRQTSFDVQGGSDAEKALLSRVNTLPAGVSPFSHTDPVELYKARQRLAAQPAQSTSPFVARPGEDTVTSPFNSLNRERQVLGKKMSQLASRTAPEGRQAYFAAKARFREVSGLASKAVGIQPAAPDNSVVKALLSADARTEAAKIAAQSRLAAAQINSRGKAAGGGSKNPFTLATQASSAVKALNPDADPQELAALAASSLLNQASSPEQARLAFNPTVDSYLGKQVADNLNLNSILPFTSDVPVARRLTMPKVDSLSSLRSAGFKYDPTTGELIGPGDGRYNPNINPAFSNLIAGYIPQR